ncbi:hypothetical protein CEXT_777081 [Caerostris extrusa]|uniref:Uncharacterized protein n=1 Tax=Caerostris extrusa TaxID=172846 RepID=A0AAV4V5Z3_CAEEX|nr:hypothetical protein CEXT_777081 [Caerostris extrusa]
MSTIVTRGLKYANLLYKKREKSLGKKNLFSTTKLLSSTSISPSEKRMTQRNKNKEEEGENKIREDTAELSNITRLLMKMHTFTRMQHALADRSLFCLIFKASSLLCAKVFFPRWI